ncbi:MAG: type VI secretion system ATPase TssH [Gammaproteobacteria bacterium]|nr:type VI secretion system ATPase TssH [Gammaproteobacteria bacterium]
MSGNPLKTLVGKLDAVCYRALESAASICARFTHYDIEIEHWLLALLESEQAVLVKMLQASNCDLDKITHDINLSLEKLKRGNNNAPTISGRVIDLINEAWLIVSLDLDGREINSGVLLCALLQNHNLSQVAQAISKEFGKVDVNTIRDLLNKVEAEVPVAPSHDDQNTVTNKITKTPSLDQFTINLNEQAEAGKIDPAIGREHEITQIVDILARRKQNNAILTGEPGVGKTAIVEGLALRIVAGDVPDNLKNVVIRTLDLGLLQAGAGVKGEFENRLKGLINEIKKLAQPIILFIDEAHTMIGAGAQSGQGDAANLLKPALARGELRCIAATTWAEYKQYFEKDAALTRRFQVVKVEEPDTATALQMLRGIAGGFETHHQVKILESAINAATLLSERYITGRYLPDKSISVLDTACARVAGKQTSQPAELECLRKTYAQLELELNKLSSEKLRGIEHGDKTKLINKQLREIKKDMELVEKRWQDERKISEKIIAKSAELDRLVAENKSKAALAKIQTELKKLNAQLLTLQGEAPLVQPYVDSEAVASVIADWTGIPVGRMLKDEVAQMVDLEAHLNKRIVGQDDALGVIASNLRTAGAKLADPNKPIGVFLFVGPSGVGKTETALALAEFLYNSEDKMTVINMSEFKEEHKISMLSGSPPGYVGYGEGGVLTEAVRRNPYSIVLLDEMEKAHQGVQEVFYQVFDKGMLKDGQGRDINFKNSLVVMTSNVCSEVIEYLYSDEKELPTYEQLVEALNGELEKTFKPAFLGRVTIIPYLPLLDNVLRDIVVLKLGCVAKQMQAQHNIALSYSNKVLAFITKQCTNQSIGARQIDNILRRVLLPQLSEIVLMGIVDDKVIKGIGITITKNAFSCKPKYAVKRGGKNG